MIEVANKIEVLGVTNNGETLLIKYVFSFASKAVIDRHFAFISKLTNWNSVIVYCNKSENTVDTLLKSEKIETKTI